MTKMYYIENNGCDATTYGLARMSDSEFAKFKEIIKNLNKNSYYGCMPTIAVYEIFETDVCEVEYEPAEDEMLHLDGKTYSLKDSSIIWENERKRVI